ncbi:hypothetical protein E2320_019100 [Naja naja]|nr:hypothetical protein E2320_019100 [Naja naja]
MASLLRRPRASRRRRGLPGPLLQSVGLYLLALVSRGERGREGVRWYASSSSCCCGGPFGGGCV